MSDPSFLQTAFLCMDSILIAPFRILHSSVCSFFLGTWILTLLCIIFGDALHILVSTINAKRLASLQNNMRHYHVLSEKALALGDKASFKAVNAQAHDAFGHYFSFSAALFCVSMCPVPFAMAWLDGRFAGVTPSLPWDMWIIGQNPSTIFWFLLLYIPSRIGYAKLLQRSTWYASLRTSHATMDTIEQQKGLEHA